MSPAVLALAILLVGPAHGEEPDPATAAVDSGAFVPDPVAGHPLLELRVGGQVGAPTHPYVCGELTPVKRISIEGCGNGSGFLHQADVPDMAHFRARGAVLQGRRQRLAGELLVGVGFAEVQRTADEPGFQFGEPTEPEPVEAAGPEVSVGAKGRWWMDSKVYMSADATIGAAWIPGAPAVLDGDGPTVPFAGASVGVGF